MSELTDVCFIIFFWHMRVVFTFMLLQFPSKSSQRKANGGLKAVEFDSSESELRAQRLKWSFIAAGDPKPFTLFYNDSLWPKSILHRERLILKSGRVVTFKTTRNGTFQALFIGKVKTTYEDEACDRVIEKMKKKSRGTCCEPWWNTVSSFSFFFKKSCSFVYTCLKIFLISL